MQIDILTLFPESIDAMLGVSILGRAQERGHIAIRTHQIRQYTTNKQMQVDDYPYGGGRGAVMQADPLYRCWAHVVETYGPGRTIFMSPCGRTFTQEVARELKHEAEAEAAREAASHTLDSGTDAIGDGAEAHYETENTEDKGEHDNG